MIFESLSSELIKQALAAKMQYSLGYKMIAAVIKAHKPLPISFETGELDTSPITALKQSKRAFASFQDYCMTHGYQIDPIEAVIASYIKGTGKPTSGVPKEVINLRAKISGVNQEKLNLAADKARTIAMAKQEEELEKLKTEFMDLTIYTNGFYQHDAAIGNNATDEFTDSYMEIEDLIPDSWVIENYPKAVKAQTNFWQRYNNWDDAEVMLIASDQDLIDSSKA